MELHSLKTSGGETLYQLWIRNLRFLLHIKFTLTIQWVRYCGGRSGSGEEKVESRLGFPTIASGHVTITLNVVHQVEENIASLFCTYVHCVQAKAFLVGGNSGGGRLEKRKFLMDRLSSATLFSSVNTVLEAFRRAREKMAAAKEGLEHPVSKLENEE